MRQMASPFWVSVSLSVPEGAAEGLRVRSSKTLWSVPPRTRTRPGADSPVQTLKELAYRVCKGVLAADSLLRAL